MALLAPRVAVVVVAVALPEAGLVAVAQLQRAHPLGALPEVQVGDDDAHRATVDRLDRLAARTRRRRSPGRRWRRPARRWWCSRTRRARSGASLRLDAGAVEQVAQAHAGPGGVELAPLRDAVDVERHVLTGQVTELRSSTSSAVRGGRWRNSSRPGACAGSGRPTGPGSPWSRTGRAGRDRRFSAESCRLRWNPRETGLIKSILAHRLNRPHPGPRKDATTGDQRSQGPFRMAIGIFAARSKRCGFHPGVCLARKQLGPLPLTR